MTYNEETYILESIRELKHTIRSPTFKQFIKETHENNIMLKQIIKYLNNEVAHHNKENIDDFGRNILANIISTRFGISNK